MPGGTGAIQNPWRMAVSCLYNAYGNDFLELDLPLLGEISPGDLKVIIQMMQNNINSPLTSSCGRLFDAVSAILGIRKSINYEAQAAIEMEMRIDENCSDHYENAVPDLSSGNMINTTPLIRAVVDDILKVENMGVISARFHRTLGEISVKAVKRIRDEYKINTVGLSGGVFQNHFFFNYLLNRLKSEGFNVITHNSVPTNDGGLALGQVVIASRLFQADNQVEKR